MNKENVRRWVEALRSGEYPQGKGNLRTRSGYCCLGVACEISGLAAWEADVYGDPVYLGETNYLPIEVREWLGIEADGLVYAGDVPVLVNNVRRQASSLNDQDGLSFDEIAALIEDTYLTEEAS